MRTLLPIRGVRDYTCGFRAYDLGVLRRVIARSSDSFFDQDGFQVMVDVLLKLRRHPDIVFGEIPLVLRYDLKKSASKLDITTAISKTLQVAMRQLVGRQRTVRHGLSISSLAIANAAEQLNRSQLDS
jgi:dolichol-phosphate mannosyltransferase